MLEADEPTVVLDPDVAADYFSFIDPEMSRRYATALAEFKFLIPVLTYCRLYEAGWRRAQKQHSSPDLRDESYAAFCDYLAKLVSSDHLSYQWPFLNGMTRFVEMSGSNAGHRAGSERIWCGLLAAEYGLQIATVEPRPYEGLFPAAQLLILT